jgi:hypothetical protein
MPGSNDNHFLAFFKKKESFLKIFFFESIYLNLSCERVTAELLAHLEELLKGSPGRLVGGLYRGAGGGEGVTTEVVVGQPETLERVPGRHLERSVCRRDLVLVKGGAVGVNVDDGVSRRHFDEYLFGMFYYRNSVFMLNSDNMKKRQFLSTFRVK